MEKMSKAEEYTSDDLPVLILSNQKSLRVLRVKPLPRKIRDFGIKRLNLKQRQALQNFYEKAKDPASKTRALTTLKKESAVEAGYSEGGAIKAMDRLLQRKAIVEELEKAGVTDAKIAEVILEGFSATHPMKPEQKDYHAVVKFVQEANKLKENYPDTKLQISKESKTIVVHLTTGNIEQFNKYQRMRELNEFRDTD